MIPFHGIWMERKKPRAGKIIIKIFVENFKVKFVKSGIKNLRRIFFTKNFFPQFYHFFKIMKIFQPFFIQ